MAGVAAPPPPSSLNGPIGPHRRWVLGAGAARRREDRPRGARRHGQRRRAGRASPVASARCCSRAASPSQRVVRTLVPVSVRARRRARPRTTTASRRSSPSCPWASRDPVERLAAIARADGRPQGVEARRWPARCSSARRVRAADAARARRCALATRDAAAQREHRDDQRPRPPEAAVCRRPADARVLPLRSDRRARSRSAWRSSPTTARADFGVTGDYDTASDIDVLCRRESRSRCAP